MSWPRSLVPVSMRTSHTQCSQYANIEANALKRGPKDVSFCKLELKPGIQPRACNPIRAGGITEEEMKKKLKESLINDALFDPTVLGSCEGSWFQNQETKNGDW